MTAPPPEVPQCPPTSRPDLARLSTLILSVVFGQTVHQNLDLTYIYSCARDLSSFTRNEYAGKARRVRTPNGPNHGAKSYFSTPCAFQYESVDPFRCSQPSSLLFLSAIRAVSWSTSWWTLDMDIARSINFDRLNTKSDNQPIVLKKNHQIDVSRQFDLYTTDSASYSSEAPPMYEQDQPSHGAVSTMKQASYDCGPSKSLNPPKFVLRTIPHPTRQPLSAEENHNRQSDEIRPSSQLPRPDAPLGNRIGLNTEAISESPMGRTREDETTLLCELSVLVNKDVVFGWLTVLGLEHPWTSPSWMNQCRAEWASSKAPLHARFGSLQEGNTRLEVRLGQCAAYGSSPMMARPACSKSVT